jgi:hypothetical protein
MIWLESKKTLSPNKLPLDAQIFNKISKITFK